MLMASRTARRRGFTLLELLTVLTVLALLAGLLFPVLGRARERGRRITCLSRLRQLSQAHLLYLLDWDEQLVYWYLPAPGRPKSFGPRYYWTEFLQPYLCSEALFRDPSAREKEREWDWLADYAMVTWEPGGQSTPEQPHYFWPGPPLSLGQVVRPAQTIHLVDGRSTMNGASIDSWSDRGWTQGEELRHDRGSNVAFLDGHVTWLPPEELQHVLPTVGW
jgi:prepilin-type N-terminal cleavage/methylation domain-containing protein/prepilin-type processing-associated H-X9-DG protein